jgi:hypothetical protein
MSMADSQLPKSDWLRSARLRSKAVRGGIRPDNAMTIKIPKRRKSKASASVVSCTHEWYFCDDGECAEEDR